jgi:hypothetical protein
LRYTTKPINILWNVLIAASHQKTTDMPANYSIPVVHPSFELLKSASRLLHFMAAAFIALDAVHHLSVHQGGRLVCYAQLIIATDIFILLFFGAAMLCTTPRIGLLFRLIEALTFLGLGATLASEGHPLLGAVHFAMSAAYFFLWQREYKISVSESIEIKPTGITVPQFFAHAELSWPDIKSVMPKYHSIIIETFKKKQVHFQLRHNLKIEELQQIDEFCSRHLITG